MKDPLHNKKPTNPHPLNDSAEPDHAQDVTTRLKAEAKGAAPEPSPFLHSRIMGSIARADLEKSAIPDAPFFVRFLPQMATAAALIAALAYIVIQPAPQTPPEISSLPTEQVSPTTTKVVQLAKVTAGRRLHEMGEALSAPLENEMRLALNDAKNAVGFLAQSFLPSNLETPLPWETPMESQ
ncbi:hypothetical protein N9B94_01940 [Verrucomicrobia bacterium]|nr:hypothetical protein [Verrucomicrobiota bacterium]